jgi:hypothetical protein
VTADHAGGLSAEHVGGCNAACVEGEHFLHADPPDIVTFGSEGSYLRRGQIGYEMAVAMMRAQAERDSLASRTAALRADRDALRERVEALCDEWDRYSKGESATTRRIREAIEGKED